MRPIDLIAGPYTPPALQVGSRAFCLYRDTDVVITAWTDARLPWPRCRALDTRGGSGLLVNDELLRAIRTESAEAVRYRWAVGTKAVWNWRKAFGIGQWGSQGSRQLLQQNAAKAHDAIRGAPMKLTLRQWQKRSKAMKGTVRRLLGAKGHCNNTDRPWTVEEIALLGTGPDFEIGMKVKRSRIAVRHKRLKLGIPSVQWRRWTAAEDELVLKLPHVWPLYPSN